ncbi:TPA: helix-turn-helix domain-containing protein [Clostridium perfringens]|nr:helix-turn-helix domain-containing protein [Clostridium perfringens]MDM0597596.1 helix-turn-helix domain-containing protein [Clostridium perfringens]HBI7101280.1 helix-turn-helix domain-containing protein [Clostridium perfringens]HBI7113731.1 helix-turn-helix domain-containing protein [Clostridium perfringens]HBI7117660.1 helix-turn-helix domain-containing protein [Clostridium perfringens]
MADKEVLNGNVNALMLSNRIVFNNISIDLDRVEKMVLISLVNHNNWKTGICNPSIKTIQDEWFYKSDREVIKALKSLREKNIISKQTIKRRNYYKLNIALILKDYLQNDGNPQNVGNLQNEGDNTPQNVGNDYPQNEGTNNERTMKEQLNIYSSNDEDNISYFERINKEIDDLENEINNKYDKDLVTKEKKKLINKNLGTLELLKELKKQLDKSIKRNSNQDIEEIWSLYPLKKGKASAIKKIPKLLKEYGKEQIVRCIGRYIEEIKKENKSKEFILHGSTFFNGRYIDYLDCNYQEDIITKPKEEPKRRQTNLDDL